LSDQLVCSNQAASQVAESLLDDSSGKFQFQARRSAGLLEQCAAQNAAPREANLEGGKAARVAANFRPDSAKQAIHNL